MGDHDFCSLMRTSRIGAATAALVLALVVTSCAVQEDAAKERVRAVLGGLQEAGGDSRHVSTQTAVCQWARGVMILLDEGDLSIAANRFTTWANEKGIFRKIASYEITGTETFDEEGIKGVIVSVTIEGRPLKIRVIKGAPLSWVS